MPELKLIHISKGMDNSCGVRVGWGVGEMLFYVFE